MSESGGHWVRVLQFPHPDSGMVGSETAELCQRALRRLVSPEGETATLSQLMKEAADAFDRAKWELTEAIRTDVRHAGIFALDVCVMDRMSFYMRETAKAFDRDGRTLDEVRLIVADSIAFHVLEIEPDSAPTSVAMQVGAAKALALEHKAISARVQERPPAGRRVQ